MGRKITWFTKKKIMCPHCYYFFQKQARSGITAPDFTNTYKHI